MKISTLVTAVAGVLFVAGASPVWASPAEAVAEPVEVWAGSLDTGAGVLRLELHVTTAEDGTQTAELVSIDQGNVRITVDRIHIGGGHMAFTISAIAGSYEGTIDEEAAVAEGTWSQGGMELPLTLRRTEPVN